ncbi:unnamed protein product [marine sediment metagenome]|uniref:Uncharacterized protein n=1 Tax=marine sediment metagenome TaxID=412755 RepID=X1FXM7_9ZZZZ
MKRKRSTIKYAIDANKNLVKARDVGVINSRAISARTNEKLQRNTINTNKP